MVEELLVMLNSYQQVALGVLLKQCVPRPIYN